MVLAELGSRCLNGVLALEATGAKSVSSGGQLRKWDGVVGSRMSPVDTRQGTSTLQQLQRLKYCGYYLRDWGSLLCPACR